MRHPHWYFCDLWRVNFYYFLGWKWNDFCNYIKKHHDYVVDHEAPSGKCIMKPTSKGGQVMIWTAKKSDLNSLVHECVHAANWLTERAGYSINPNNDEAYAYLVTNIFRQATVKHKN